MPTPPLGKYVKIVNVYFETESSYDGLMLEMNGEKYAFSGTSSHLNSSSGSAGIKAKSSTSFYRQYNTNLTEALNFIGCATTNSSFHFISDASIAEKGFMFEWTIVDSCEEKISSRISSNVDLNSEQPTYCSCGAPCLVPASLTNSNEKIFSSLNNKCFHKNVKTIPSSYSEWFDQLEFHNPSIPAVSSLNADAQSQLYQDWFICPFESASFVIGNQLSVTFAKGPGSWDAHETDVLRMCGRATVRS